MRRLIFFLLVMGTLLSGCASAPPTAAVLPTPTPAATDDAFYQGDGGGDPRTAGYWLVWNSCAPENRAETARANGGRAAGWILVDDLLEDPGIWLGDLQVEDCPQAARLLQVRNLSGEARGEDSAYRLAAELLVALLNLNAGAESCLAAVDAVLKADALLAEVGFDGQGDFLARGNPSLAVNRAEEILAVLSKYNYGDLCN